MSETTERPKAVQDILDKLDGLIDVVKQSRERNPMQTEAGKRVEHLGNWQRTMSMACSI